MKQSNNLNNLPISGESFFDQMPQKFYPLDKTFVPLDKSIIWHFNYLFWKHFSLWEKTYHEQYEASLPTGISESHKDEFIQKSVHKCIRLLSLLERDKKLPKKFLILEQGPGTGMYAKKFLDYLQAYSQEQKKNYYEKIRYILQDTSKEMLNTAYKTLMQHKQHIAGYIDLPKTLHHKILFARHSNLWDQLPARLLLFEEHHISEILVQAVINKELKQIWHSFFHCHAEFISASPYPNEEIPKQVRDDKKNSFDKTIKQLQHKHIEKFIITCPRLWKPLMRSIILKTKVKKLHKKEISDLPYSKTLVELARINVGTQEVIFSKGVLDNIVQLLELIDWKRNGYTEIVDIIVPEMTGFAKSRRPKKYDGSVATVVNGPLIKTFLKQHNKHARITKIRGLNHTLIMRNHDMQTLLENRDFITIGEIAARRDQPLTSFCEETNALFELGIDVVAFSDQAFVKPYYLTQKELIDSRIFTKLPGHALMPIVKTRNKSLKEINSLTRKLKKQDVSNIFLVTGDPGLEKELLNTSLSVLPKLKDDFFCGAVAHSHVNDIPKTLEKIKAGAKFFIMQATYNQKKWEAWAEKIKELEIHKKAYIIAAIVPIVSQRTLSVLQFIDDMSVSEKIIKEFAGLDKKTLREKGIALAQNMVTLYKQCGIFSGIYIYSKSPEVICDVMGFPYHKTKDIKDSL